MEKTPDEDDIERDEKQQVLFTLECRACLDDQSHGLASDHEYAETILNKITTNVTFFFLNLRKTPGITNSMMLLIAECTNLGKNNTKIEKCIHSLGSGHTCI